MTDVREVRLTLPVSDIEKQSVPQLHAAIDDMESAMRQPATEPIPADPKNGLVETVTVALSLTIVKMLTRWMKEVEEQMRMKDSNQRQPNNAGPSILAYELAARHRVPVESITPEFLEAVIQTEIENQEAEARARGVKVATSDDIKALFDADIELIP